MDKGKPGYKKDTGWNYRFPLVFYKTKIREINRINVCLLGAVVYNVRLNSRKNIPAEKAINDLSKTLTE